MPSRVVRPLQKNQKTVDFHLGGPLIGFAGKTIPMPLTSLNYAQGITDKLTGFGSIHTTSLMFGVLQTDIGACYGLYYSDSLRIGLSVTPALNIATDLRENNFKVWPQLDVNLYWELKPQLSFIYVGIDNWFELSGVKAHEETQENRWLFSPQIGFRYVRKKWNYNIESKYLLPYLNNTPNVVDYKGINGKGAIGIYLTLTRKF